jgi:hypothetical protein
MVKEFNKGMFKNNWIDFSLRQNVQDGRCYRAEPPPDPDPTPVYRSIQRLQKKQFINTWEFVEFENVDSEMRVYLAWSVLKNETLLLAESQACNIEAAKQGSGISGCYITNAPYTGAMVYLWRIDDPNITTTSFNWETTAVKRIGSIRRIFQLREDDTGNMVITDGGEGLLFTSNLKWKADPNNSAETWKSLEFDTGFQGPEKTDNRLQTNTYYYLTVEPFSFYAPTGEKTFSQTIQDEFIRLSLTSVPTKPSNSLSIVDSRTYDYFYYAFGDRESGNDYFPWFLTPNSFAVKKKSTPSIRWGNWADIPTQTSTSSPSTNGTVTGVVTSDPTKFEIELKGTFFYETIDLNEQNQLKLPDDVPMYVGFAVKDLNVSGSDFVIAYEQYVGGLFLDQYVQQLPAAIGGVDTTRHFDFSYIFTSKANKTYQYRIFLRKESNQVWYASGSALASPYKGNISPSSFQINTGKFDVLSWVDPPSRSTGHWYQMLQCWKEVSSVGRLSPYMTMRRLAPSGTNAVPGTNVAIVANYPIHYYLNYSFFEEKNYLFRTILEYFYTTNGNTSAMGSNLQIITPWGEKLRLETPYLRINLANVPSDMKRFNMYIFANINGFSAQNNPKIQDVNGKVKEKPVSVISSKSNPQNPITYTATPYFGGDTMAAGDQSLISGLNYVTVTELEWFVQGSATFNIMSQVGGGAVQTVGTEKIPYFLGDEPFGGRGWHHIAKEKKFVWFDKVGPAGGSSDDLLTELNSNLPIGGDPGDYFSNKEGHVKYLRNNFIATYVPYQNFNVSFDYVNETPFDIVMYLGGELPFAGKDLDFWKTDIDDLISRGLVTRVGVLSESTGSPQKCEFIGLVGNQYLFFVADPVIKFGNALKTVDLFQDFYITEEKFITIFQKQVPGYPITPDGVPGFGTYSIVSLSNFTFAGAYSEGNNRVYTTNSNLSTNIKNATYSIVLGSGNNVFKNIETATTTIHTVAGNGSFVAGTWENGVWNSGLHEDITVSEFNTLVDSFFYNRGRTWRMSIGGRPSSIANFSVGDVVSISNVVAIDINEKRKLINKSYTILSIDETSITVEFETNFPIKRIEKDSDEHRILVSKNIWANGVFLNGYFSGIWNNGLFSGFPLITKMEGAHWIDGIFNGGQFIAQKIKATFTSIYEAVYEGTPRLGINFNNPHGIEVYDTISITYSNLYSAVNSLGTTTVLSVPSPLSIITGIAFDKKYKGAKDGTVNTTTSTGLIQNFKFYSNNVSKVTSLDTMRSERVFSYNSWIDVNYSNKSAVNVGRPQTFIETTSERQYSENNLYGYPTNDVLTSDSVFRDSFSLTLRRYRLGKKYSILNDYVGVASAFEKSFGPTDTQEGIESFEEQGWKSDTRSSSEFKMNTKGVGMNIPSTGGPNTLYLDFSDNILIKNIKAGDTINVSGYQFQRYEDTQSIPFGGSGYAVGPSFPVVEAINVESVTTPTTGTYRLVTNSTKFTLWNVVGPNWDLSRIYSIEINIDSKMVISRTPEPVTPNSPLVGKEIKIVAKGHGGVVNLIPTQDIDKRTNGKENETVGKLNYTMVEFEVADFIRSNNLYEEEKLVAPPLHFNNTNYVTRLVRDINGERTLSTIVASYLPVYRNVNHMITPGRKKQEFFFNKRNLLMNFTGSGYHGYYQNEFYLDNLKFYEVDMIPFFQYFTSPRGRKGNINTSVQIPNSGTSPSLVPTDEFVIDADFGNDVVNQFSDTLIATNVPVPKGVNWRNDYAIYRTQRQDITSDPGLYKEN